MLMKTKIIYMTVGTMSFFYLYLFYNVYQMMHNLKVYISVGNVSKIEKNSDVNISSLVNATEKVNVVLPIPNSTVIFTHQNKSWFPNNILGSPCLSNGSSWRMDSNKCSLLKFPLKKALSHLNVPSECWPRLVIVPSFPTSGSSLVRNIFSVSTGLAHGSHYKKEGENVFDFGGDSIFGTQFFTHSIKVCNGNLRLPYSGRVAFVKTHSKFFKHFSNESSEAVLQPSFIVRLVRNPGDNLLRNVARWRQHGKNRNNDDFQSFSKRARSFCRDVPVYADKWVEFHESWEEGAKKLGIPIINLMYEHVLNLNLVKQAMKKVIEFVGENSVYDVNYTQVLRLPSYVHGTLVKEVCGKEMARKLNEKTRNVSENLGYTFNFTEGVWKIPEYNF